MAGLFFTSVLIEITLCKNLNFSEKPKTGVPSLNPLFLSCQKTAPMPKASSREIPCTFGRNQGIRESGNQGTWKSGPPQRDPFGKGMPLAELGNQRTRESVIRNSKFKIPPKGFFWEKLKTQNSKFPRRGFFGKNSKLKTQNSKLPRRGSFPKGIPLAWEKLKTPPKGSSKGVLSDLWEKLLLSLVLILVSLSANGQKNRLDSSEMVLSADTIPAIKSDTAKRRPAPTDSITVNKGGIQTTIKYYAEDSIITQTLTNVTHLYGKAYIEYGDIKLDAAEIVINRNTNELTARGVQDSTNAWIGLPIFQDGPEKFETREIRYNFSTKKARIKGVATQQQEGFLSGKVVKRNKDGSAYIAGGRYIPCEDPQGTTYIKSSKIKVIPGDKVITGPFNLYVGDIPTPLWLPFGMFPEPKSKEKSGILFPTYGDEQNRGLFLRDGGYFFVWNRKLTTALTADIYSKGSWGIKAINQYRKRYVHSGRFEFTLTRNKNLKFEENAQDSRDFWFSWSHQPESRGTARFSASVNLGSSTFNQNNLALNNFQRNIRSEFRSNISYSNSIAGTPFSYSVNARHSQNVQTGIVDVSLPEFSANMNRIFPMKKSKMEVLKKLNVGWNLNITNRITNVVRPANASYKIANKTRTEQHIIPVRFTTLNQLLANAANGARHSIPVSTSFPLLKNFNLTPSAQFQELWYLQKLNYTFIEEQNAVKVDTIRGFSRANTYSASLGLSTQLYGMFNTRHWRNVEAIRHIMTPSLSFGYRPDFSKERFGYYQKVQTDKKGTTRLLSIYDGFVSGNPGLGESASMSFSISNKVEMKVLNDTTDAKKVSLIENLSINGAYNFLADSFNLSNLNLSFRTSIFNRKVNLNAGMTLDPYTYLTNTEGRTRRVNAFAWKSGQGLGRVTNARFGLSTSFNSEANNSRRNENPNQRKGNGFVDDPAGEYGSINDGGEESTLKRPAQFFYDPNVYVDVKIPWNVNLRYNYSYSRGLSSSTTRQSIEANGQLRLTPKWQITLNTGYDLDRKELTQTSMGVYRDLGCWEMRANWIPFGRFTSYNIDIQIKASSLRDLRISRRRSFFDF